MAVLLALATSAPAAAQTNAPPPGGSLLVTCPGPCRVRVDGEEMGDAPAVVRGLLPGQHLVEAISPDGSSFRGLAEVMSGRSTAFEVALAPAASPTPPGPGRAAPSSTAGSVTEGETWPTEAGPPQIDDGAYERTSGAGTDTAVSATRHARGVVTPAPPVWDGGMQSQVFIPVVAFVVGGLAVLGGVGTLLYATGLPPSDGDQSAFTLVGGLVSGIGGVLVGVGVLGLLLFKGPGPADRTGSVYFGAVELAPVLVASPQGALIGGRARW